MTKKGLIHSVLLNLQKLFNAERAIKGLAQLSRDGEEGLVPLGSGGGTTRLEGGILLAQ